jgi:hypothetical protein
MLYNYRMRRLFKRWYFWLTVLIVLPVLFITIGVLYQAQSPVNQTNFDRVKLGMAEEQLVAILGEPNHKRTEDGGGFKTLLWLHGPDVIAISLDEGGKVSSKEYNPPTAWRRLRWHVNNWLVRISQTILID